MGVGGWLSSQNSREVRFRKRDRRSLENRRNRNLERSVGKGVAVWDTRKWPGILIIWNLFLVFPK